MQLNICRGAWGLPFYFGIIKFHDVPSYKNMWMKVDRWEGSFAFLCFHLEFHWEVR